VLIILFAFGIHPEKVYAVGGISNSKVIVPSTDTVPKSRIEIEPFFNYLFVDDSDNTRNYDIGGRFTYGLLDNVEIGSTFFFVTFEDSDLINTDSTFGNIEPGIKWRILDQEGQGFLSYSVAYEGGLTIPTSGSDEKWAFEPIGIILTKNFNDRFSMDNDIVLRIVEDELWGINSNHGLGYFITDWLQPVVEMAYTYNNIDNENNEHVLNITGGFTAPMTDFATLIVGVTKDIVSHDTEDTLAITTALTLLF
ncbi:MAG: hypothetical protein ACR2NW_05130, partial [Thermodesulfobacteriota bacterium]